MHIWPLFTSLRALAGALALTCAVCPALGADEPNLLRDVPQMIRAGKLDAAERIVDRVLAAKPKDPAARFQKSVLLTERGRLDEAIALLQELSSEYPELPEPYNNLAALYATKGRYDDARWALVAAEQADPSYALAEENLGDMYLKLADIAYEKAAKLSPNNQSLITKRNSLRGLIPAAKPSTPAAAPAQAESPQPASR